MFFSESNENGVVVASRLFLLPEEKNSVRWGSPNPEMYEVWIHAFIFTYRYVILRKSIENFREESEKL